MTKVKFICVSNNKGKLQTLMECVKEIDKEQSIREICLDISNELVETGKIKQSPEIAKIPREKLELFINIKNEEQSCETPKLYFQENNQVLFLQPYKELVYDWRYGDFEKLHQYGYLNGDVETIVFYPATMVFGKGSAGLNLFSPESLELLMTYKDYICTGFWVLSFLYNKLKRRKIRAVAKKWQEKNGVTFVYQLRYFVDNGKDWTVRKLKRQLGIKKTFARKLLKQLGYIDVCGTWYKGDDELSKKRRANWMKNEEIRPMIRK